jgi:hypothetical protein
MMLTPAAIAPVPVASAPLRQLTPTPALALMLTLMPMLTLMLICTLMLDADGACLRWCQAPCRRWCFGVTQCQAAADADAGVASGRMLVLR